MYKEVILAGMILALTNPLVLTHGTHATQQVIDVPVVEHIEEVIPEPTIEVSRGDLQHKTPTLVIDSKYNLRTYEHVGVNQLENALRHNLKGKAHIMIQYAEEYELSVYFIVAVAALESGWGTSSMAKNKNNYFGFLNGREYTNFEQSLQAFCELMTTHYLDANGKYFNGYTVEAVNVRYCLKNSAPDLSWSRSINELMSEIAYNSNIPLGD